MVEISLSGSGEGPGLSNRPGLLDTALVQNVYVISLPDCDPDRGAHSSSATSSCARVSPFGNSSVCTFRVHSNALNAA